jgi:hypothetical protein
VSHHRFQWGNSRKKLNPFNIVFSEWWAREDSNPQPSGYERPNCAGKFSNIRRFRARSLTFVLVWLRRFIGPSLVEHSQKHQRFVRVCTNRRRHVLRGRSLHTGEVVGSIPTAPTTNTQRFIAFFVSALPFPPPVDREHSVFPPAILGENPGSLFNKCSARNRAKALLKVPTGAMTTATEADIQVESSNALGRASTVNPKPSIRPVKQCSPSADCPRHLFSGYSLRFSVVCLEGIRASPKFNARSGKNAAKDRFGLKGLFAAVRMATHALARARPPPQ